MAERPALEAEDLYRALLRENRARDAAAGRTLIGPQASDLAVLHGPKQCEARRASTGEQKALLVGLVLAHARLVAAMSGIAPLVLLDEIAAHFDPARRNALFDALQALGGQVWMTGADERLFDDLRGRADIFAVAGGRLTRAAGRKSVTDLAKARRLLKTVFGFDDFRSGQQEIVEAVLSNDPVLAVMPTGSGKSLCYQLPALLGEGLTLVISPLIALMRDQVGQMQALGLAAATLNSQTSEAEARETWAQIRKGELKLLFLSPERLAMQGLIEALSQAGVKRVAVDEAHCICEWGHDFRPEYRMIRESVEKLGDVQVIAFTATADRAMRAEIAERLFSRKTADFRSFLRPAQYFPVFRGERPAEKAIGAVFDRAARPKRHRLLRLARRDRKAGRAFCRPKIRRPSFITPGWSKAAATPIRTVFCATMA